MHVYSLNGDSLSEKKSFTVGDQVTTGAFSPDGGSLVISVGKHLVIYNAASYEVRDFAQRLGC